MTSLSRQPPGRSSPPSRSRSTWRPDVALGQAVDAIHAAERRDRPAADASTPASRARPQAFQASLASEPILILAALFTVYIVLGVLYESFIHPITILSTLPSAGVGALLALLVIKTDFSIIALIGIILLIGIVKKNAIMMIDFAHRGGARRGPLPARGASTRPASCASARS